MFFVLQYYIYLYFGVYVFRIHEGLLCFVTLGWQKISLQNFVLGFGSTFLLAFWMWVLILEFVVLRPAPAQSCCFGTKVSMTNLYWLSVLVMLVLLSVGEKSCLILLLSTHALAHTHNRARAPPQYVQLKCFWHSHHTICKNNTTSHGHVD
jgi:hypothetical protein